MKVISNSSLNQQPKDQTMKYNVVLAAQAIRCPEAGFVPGTERDMTLDTKSGLGKNIWWGYLEMREEQKKTPVPDDSPSKVHLPDTESEQNKFREAINLFFRYLAGEGSDNCLVVKSIEPAPEAVATS
jgi:hypothetical protein